MFFRIMKVNVFTIMVSSVLLCVLISCSGKSGEVDDSGYSSEGVFKATGNTDPNRRAPREKQGEVVVTFDMLPTTMSFNLPSFCCMVTENGICYHNGWTETYDSKVEGLWFEPLMDMENRYSRMWIESQNDARIVVRWRGAMCNREDFTIAHSDVPSGSPYGDGDWFDEWYIIYPDGVHVRTSRIYTYYADESVPLSWELYCYFEEPSEDIVHEFQEMLLLGGRPGRLAEDDLEKEALTLIKMNGQSSTIFWEPYPIEFKPTKEQLYTAFGEFSNANMFVVNTKSEYRPFTIARMDSVNISPYPPEREERSGVFQSWPQEPKRESGYDGAGLGHIINRVHYQKTDNTLTHVYLSGWTNAKEPAKELVPLGRSWLYAPKMKLINKEPVTMIGYDMTQRAYVIDCQQVEEPDAVTFEILASIKSPVVNPAFVLKGWGEKDIILKADGKTIKQGADFRVGYEQRDGDIDMVLWLKAESDDTMRFTIRRKD